jgi:hypothetical protein
MMQTATIIMMGYPDKVRKKAATTYQAILATYPARTVKQAVAANTQGYFPLPLPLPFPFPLPLLHMVVSFRSLFCLFYPRIRIDLLRR